jgi:hypothetical protein
VIRREGTEFVVEDAGSRNGIDINVELDVDLDGKLEDLA